MKKNVQWVFLLAMLLSLGVAPQAQTPRARTVWMEFPQMAEPLARVEENSFAVLPEAGSLGRLSSVSIHLGRQPQDLAGSSIGIRVNAESANVVMTQRNLEEGVVCDIPLTQNPTVALHGGSNSIEVFFRDRWNQPHYSVFLLQSTAKNSKPEFFTPANPGLSPGTAAGNRYALVVGVAHYQSQGNSLPPLAYAESDARAFRDQLVSPRGGAYREENVRILVNEEATLDNLRSALRELAKVIGPQDSLVLYLNLHGGYDSNNPERKYLLTYDSNPRSLAGTALPVEELPAWIASNARTKHVIVFADACHASKIGEGLPPRSKPANLINTYLLRAFRGQNLASLEAGDDGELSQEGAQWEGHGVFTYYLLKGLSGEADGVLPGGRRSKHDGTVFTSELFYYVLEKVQSATSDKQHPLPFVSEAGMVALARLSTGSGQTAAR